MNLPDSVFYNPRQFQLIAKDGPGIIRIETGPVQQNAAYRIVDRRFGLAIAPYLLGDWQRLDQRFALNQQRNAQVGSHTVVSDVCYSGAEHWDSPKQPNITVLPNFSVRIKDGATPPIHVSGCTMGHFHPEDPVGPRIQALYEFQSYGMMALDKGRGEVELWIAKDGDKVAVPDNCHMTLYNLDDEDHPLITLDFADPARNPVDRELAKQLGPVLLIYYNDLEVLFTLNHLWINCAASNAGIRLIIPPTNEADRQIRLSRGARVGLGRLLYEQLTRDPEIVGRLAKIGLRIQVASPEAVLEPDGKRPGSRLFVGGPLAHAVRQGSELYRRFFPNSDPVPPGPPEAPGIAARVAAIARRKQDLIRLEKLDRRLVIVVEGAGDWVAKAYRPCFRACCGKTAVLSVFYADDSRWRPRPAWAAGGSLEDWETYLDKADVKDHNRYLGLNPDVVLVVTPDFTHSAIAQSWLDRAALVCVEKPFDSHPSNVEDLLRALGRQPYTAVAGLDHYLFYALPMLELYDEIVSHLGGCLARVFFYMTENRPIELGRERSLQHGLTLDLLPHFLALLTWFGNLSTIDEIQVLEAGQYQPLEAVDQSTGDSRDISHRFLSETLSRLRFTLRDYSGNGHRVPCISVVGKGTTDTVKYFEAIGVSGNAVRIDFNKRPDDTPYPNYPWGTIFFLHGGLQPLPPGATLREIQDPYNPKRVLTILEDSNQPLRFNRPLTLEKYEALLQDLLHGTSNAVATLLSMAEASEIVRVLDIVHRALQAVGAWTPYPLCQVASVDPGGSQVP